MGSFIAGHMQLVASKFPVVAVCYSKARMYYSLHGDLFMQLHDLPLGILNRSYWSQEMHPMLRSLDSLPGMLQRR
jgi:hypothetical protein